MRPSIKRLPLPGLLLLALWLAGGPAHAQSPSVIDVAVFYTPAAKTAEGGTAQIVAKIEELVVATNMAYADSGVNQTINLVAVEEVQGYTEARSTKTDLDRLWQKSDGYMDEVHTIRERVRADAVILLRRVGGGSAYGMSIESTDFADSAFAVSGWSAWTFAHELGHIMGLVHDRYQECEASSCFRGVSADAYGYVNQRAFDSGAPASARWHTIMAYPGQCYASGNCSQVPYFSNPANCYPGACPDAGDPMGVLLTESNKNSTAVDGPANAARVLNLTRDTVAEFREGRAVKVSFAAATYAVTEGGSVTVSVQLDAAPGRTLDLPIPLTATSTDGAWSGDYDLPQSVPFSASQTARPFTFRATQDTRPEATETVTLGFGTPLPAGVTVGSPATATVTLTDNDSATTAAPSVSTVAFSSAPAGTAYAAGEAITVAVVFTKPITVTGTPHLGLTVGTTTRQAECSDAASEVLTCTYTVVADERDTDGVSIAANSLALNGGTIKDADSRDATITHSAVAATSSHTVDGDTPDVESATVDGDTVTLTYDEALDATSVPWANAFTVTAGGSTVLIAAVRVSGAVVTLDLISHVVHSDSVTLTYSPSTGTPSLRDAAGNAAATLSSRTLTNTTPQPVYDTDDDGLIEISTLAQLDAMRHDLNGDGRPTSAGATTYAAAFSRVTRVVCGATSGGCTGYELMADLDFDTDGDGSAGAGDTYWNNGAGWVPIGTFDATDFSNWFTTTFEGNGYTISNLFINRPGQEHVGLFGVTINSVIRHIGLIDVAVTGRSYVGGLVGLNQGTIRGSYTTGQVKGASNWIGGLVGVNVGTIHTSYATGRVSGLFRVGGLVGTNFTRGTIHTSYATGRVSGRSDIGGLVGRNRASIRGSYATGRVSGLSTVETGGLVGESDGTITASYWDSRTSGQTASAGGTGQTTTALQTPTGYSGIYADWNADLDGDMTDDDPWDFGTSSQYPVLKVDFDGSGAATWQEFGHQLRVGPTLTADTATVGQIALSWTAVPTTHWSPAPTVTYTVTRGDTATPLAAGLSTRTYTDTGVTSGRAYTYQVIALVDGGEGTRSARLAVTAVANQKPTFDDGSTTSRSVAENTTAGVDIGDPVAATDTDDTSLTYSLSGTDAAAFTLNSTTGQLQTQAALNYETKRSYRVIVSVRDSKNDDGETDTATDDTITVTINVVNLDEAGTVTLAGTPARERHQLTATLSDLDGGLSGIAWQWARSADQHTWTNIAMATDRRYTPGMDDVNRYLRATATYTDGHGTGKSAQAVTAQVAAAPVVTLLLTPAQIAEQDDAMTPDTNEAATVVTATLDTASSAVTTVTVTAPTSAVTRSGSTLTIAAGQTTSTGTVTLTAKDNMIDGPERKTVQVSGTTTNRLVAGPAPVDLTITDDDVAPTVTLVLSPAQISEKDKVSTVTARLSHASSEDTTVTVAANAVSPAVADDFELSANTTLMIAAGATTSTGTVTLTAVDNDIDAPDKQVTVSGTATNTHGIAGDPANATLLITDDDPTPKVTLALAPASIRETDDPGTPAVEHESTLTVTLSGKSSQPTTVTVTADPEDAVTLSGSPLTIAAGDTEGTVTVTAVNNETDGPEMQRVTIAADATNTLGVTDPANQTLTITDDDDPPEVTLAVSDTQIEESGTDNSTTVTATLSHPSYRQIEVTVAPDPAYTLSTNRRLTFAAGETASTGVVTLTATDNDIDADDAAVSVGGTASPSHTVTAADLTITDDDTRGVTVSETALSIREGSTGTYTVVLDSEPTATVTIGVASDETTVSVDKASLTFTAGNWDTAQTVTVETTDDDVTNVPAVAAEISHTVTDTASDSDYEGESVAGVDVTVTDDESPSTGVTLSVTPDAVAEGSSARMVTVTGELNGAPRSADTVVAVTVTAGTADPDDSDATQEDFTPVSSVDLTIAAEAESGTATFTLTPVNDPIDEPAETVTVDGSTTVGLAVTATTLTITDNDAPPTVTLELSANPLSEGETSQVTAMLNHPSSADTTVEVAATAVTAGADDFTLSGTSLTIPAGQTASRTSATLMATDDSEDEADEQVSVTARAENGQGVQSPNVRPVRLTIEDTDAPEVTGEMVPAYVEGGTGPVATYTASNPANVRLTWSVEGADKDAFTIANGVLRFNTTPDYEDPDNLDHEYDITVQASDGPLTGELAVIVTVEDAMGRVRLSASQPRVGSALTATLSDPDGVDTVTEWCWARSLLPIFSPADTTDADCTPTTTATYTPVNADLGHYLRATVTYTDGQGTRKAAPVQARTAEAVAAAPSRPQPPVIGGGSGGGGGGGGGESPDDHGNTPAQATRVLLDPAQSTAISGQINTPDDVDYFALPLPRSGVLVAETTGPTDTVGMVWQDTVMLAQADSGGERQNFRLRTPVAAGPVVVAVAGNGRQTGAYTLAARLLSGYLENPGPESFQSGVGVLSGWVCEAEVVEIELNGVPQEAAYGTERLDTAGVCGDTDNGFGLLFNWNLLGDGEHEVVAYVDRIELGRAHVTVTTLGQEFLRGVEGECIAEDFPRVGERVPLVWQQNSQNFVMAGGRRPAGATASRPSGLRGFLENPGPNSFQSGVRVLSGWVCEAEVVELAIGAAGRQVAAYGTERLDTAGVCGDTDNGFGLLFNWNLLGDGEHAVVAYVDDVELGRATVRVTTLGEEFLRGVEGECVVADFPMVGETVTLEWQQNSQNFVITDVE